jgi:predicted glycogen debranching enzyme
MERSGIRLGRALCGDLEAALRREWLVTDGLGGYAAGTVAGALTRAYHGLLVAATAPPLGRVLAVAGLAETAQTSRGEVSLHTQEWEGGASDSGYELCESFELDDGMPTWRFQLDGVLLEKRVLAVRGTSPGTLVVYRVVRAASGAALRLRVRPLCTWRDHHAPQREGAAPAVEAVAGGLRVDFAGAPPIWLRASAGSVRAEGGWWRGFHLRAEAERGLTCVQDLYAPGAVEANLGPGDSLALSFSLGDGADPGAWADHLAAERARAGRLRAAAGVTPGWTGDLVIAADQFIVARGAGRTVIAGYPWFGDWGRDTFIALPGLSLATGRPEIGADLLRSYAAFVDAGMLPNCFPEGGGGAEYNTVDAVWWYVEALRAHVQATGDEGLVDELWQVLEEIVAAHLGGTRHGIGVDPADGLLRAGEPGVQLTWMDAKVDGWVVTPRIGKPVEVNALWYSGLCALALWSRTRRSRHDYAALGARVQASFDRFWNADRGYCFDVVDTPDGHDARLRPNAVIAAGLHHSPLDRTRAGAVVAVAESELTTSLGLRTLARGEPGYAPRYGGDRRSRDAAYHQGTVWPWLLGSFVSAHLRIHGEVAAARSFLLPLVDHRDDAGLGSVSEIADAEPPHTPGGCPWQAWSVAELLRAWRLCEAAAQGDPGSCS